MVDVTRESGDDAGHEPGPDGAQWLTLAQAAAFLGLAPQTVGYHIAQGHLQARKLGPVWMIHAAALREFIRSAWHKPGRPRKHPRKHPRKDRSE